MPRQNLEKLIRLIPLADEYVDKVHEIEKISYKVPWSKFGFYAEIRNPFSLSYVLFLDDKIVGYIVLWDYGKSLHIANITVHPDYRRMGLGRFMIRFAKQKAKERGIRFLTLEVRKSNLPARRLYESEGFVEIGLLRGYYPGDFEDAIIYQYKAPCPPKSEEEGN